VRIYIARCHWSASSALDVLVFEYEERRKVFNCLFQSNCFFDNWMLPECLHRVELVL